MPSSIAICISLGKASSRFAVECDTVEEFMNVLEVVASNLEEHQIRYADLVVYS